MVITLSAYTEPQPVVTAVSEPPQSREPEEDAEPGAFAKLLAGLFQKTEIETADETLANLSGDDSIDILAGEKANQGKESGLFEAVSKTAGEEKELSDADLCEDQAYILLGAQRLLTSAELKTDADPNDGFLTEGAEVKVDFRVDIESELNADFSSELTEAMTDTAETVSFAPFADELPRSDTEGKKEKAGLKTEKTENNFPAESRGGELSSLQKGQEKEGLNKLESSRGKSKKDKVTFDIHDQRTGAEGVKNAQTRINAGAEIRSLRPQGEAPVREITLELRLPVESPANAADSSRMSWEVKAGSALENMLARELHQNFNGDIVRHASMALRDGGEGTIRLALKPESLGNVKIHLELTENKITGHIVVESEEALNAFKKEISSLEQAFRDSGFTNADLNLSLTADGRNAENAEQEAEARAMRNVASLYDDYSRDEDQGLFSVIDVYYGRRHGSVNMLA